MNNLLRSPEIIAKFLKINNVDTVFGLCGGHIMPIWMELDKVGIKIIDTRDERAAVFMAHSYSEFSGKIGIALVTAGPGLTNALTGIANAHISRVPLLVISGTPPIFQENRGALQDINHVEIVKSVTRYSKTVRHESLIVNEMNQAFYHALGIIGESGPSFIEFPTNVLRTEINISQIFKEFYEPIVKTFPLPENSKVMDLLNLLNSSKRILLISGRGARRCNANLSQFLEKFKVLYLDTAESKGIIDDDHQNFVPSMRSKVMETSDLIITLCRKLDFQLAYGSPAIFGNAKFVRISDTPTEISHNRRGEIELVADPKIILDQLIELSDVSKLTTDKIWFEDIKNKHKERKEKYSNILKDSKNGTDGRMHPNKIVHAINAILPKKNIVIADGGDFLSFCRVGVNANRYLDPGPFGCLGVGLPFGIGAKIADPESHVFVLTGDGSFGFTAIELDTLVRHKVPIIIIVANNGSWGIEVRDQIDNYGKVVGTKLQFSDYSLMAKSFGLHSVKVDKSENLEKEIINALDKKPALIDVEVTQEAVSADAKSGLAIVPDLQALETWDEKEKKFRDIEN